METLKSNEFKRIFSQRFFVVSAILTLLFFAVFSFVNKNYSAEEIILVNAKSEVATAQQDAIIANMIEIARSENFYDRVLKFNPDLKDYNATKSIDERKEIWNDFLIARRVHGNATMIKISVSAKTEAEANVLAKKITRTLLDTTSLYYNVKSDIDLRIIDGPITEPYISMWPLLLFESWLISFVIAFLLEYFLINRSIIFEQAKSQQQKVRSNFFESKKEESKTTENSEESQEKQTFGQKETKEEQPQMPEKKSEEIEALNKIIEQETYPNYPEMPRHTQQKASAPDNLPIADSSFFEHTDLYTRESGPEEFEQPENQQGESQNQDQTDSEQEKSKNHEPTAEEFKKRLNQLLRGKF